MKKLSALVIARKPKCPHCGSSNISGSGGSYDCNNCSATNFSA